MSRSLGIGSIAEGVETPEQHSFLLEHGCERFQGYLFGRPAPVGDLPIPGGACPDPCAAPLPA